MAAIVIQTQPTSSRYNKYATATFVTVLSGSILDESSYLTASVRWFVSSSHAPVAGATSLTFTQSNIPYSDNGKSFYMTAHSASTAGTIVTSSAVSMSILDTPTIVINTQPSSATVAEFATATFTVVLSGSIDDPKGYLTSSKQWYKSPWSAVAGQTTTTLTLANVQDTDNGNVYYFAAHSASATGTKITSSAVRLTVANKQVPYDGIDQAECAEGNYANLGSLPFGYQWFIQLIISGSELSETYCPHFVSKQDMREFILREVEQNSMTETPAANGTAPVSTFVHNTVTVAKTEITSYDGLGQTGYKYWLPLTISESYVPERYCPHFVTRQDAKTFVDGVVAAGTFTSSIGG